jgi:antitoxin component of RelBE/YafQ-DinJ toxin-antitoxin module
VEPASERIAIRVNSVHFKAIAAASRLDLTASAFVRMAALQVVRSGRWPTGFAAATDALTFS